MSATTGCKVDFSFFHPSLQVERKLFWLELDKHRCYYKALCLCMLTPAVSPLLLVTALLMHAVFSAGVIWRVNFFSNTYWVRPCDSQKLSFPFSSSAGSTGGFLHDDEAAFKATVGLQRRTVVLICEANLILVYHYPFLWMILLHNLDGTNNCGSFVPKS